MLIGSTRELSSAWSVGQFDYGATPIQTSNFSCTELNAYITNTLNKLFFTQRSARFLMRTQLVLIFWNKMVGRAGRYVSLLLREHEIYLLDVPLLYAVHVPYLKNDKNVAG